MWGKIAAVTGVFAIGYLLSRSAKAPAPVAPPALVFPPVAPQVPATAGADSPRSQLAQQAQAVLAQASQLEAQAAGDPTSLSLIGQVIALRAKATVMQDIAQHGTDAQVAVYLVGSDAVNSTVMLTSIASV